MNNVNGGEEDWCLSMESYAAIREALMPGLHLDEMNRIMIQNVAVSLDELSTTDRPVRRSLVR